MTDNFLTFDQIITNPQKRSENQISSFHNPLSSLASPNKIRDNPQDHDTNTMKYKIVEQNQDLEQKLMNKYLKNNSINQQTNKFLSTRNTPIKQRNGQGFMSPQVKNYIQIPYEESNKIGQSSICDSAFYQGNINTIKSNLNSDLIDNSISALKNQCINPYVEKETKHQKQDFGVQIIIDENLNKQHGIKKVLSTDSLFTKKIIESQNPQYTQINNQGGSSSRNQIYSNNLYSSHSNFQNLSKNNTYYNHSNQINNTQQLSNFAKETKSQIHYSSSNDTQKNTGLQQNQPETFMINEQKSDGIENAILANREPTMRFSYQHQKQNQDNSFHKHSKSNSIFTGLIPRSSSKVENPTYQGGFTPQSPQEKQFNDFNHMYSTRQLQLHHQIKSGYSNTTSNTPTKQESNNSLANNYNIGKFIEDNRKIQDQIKNKTYNYNLQSQRQNYQISTQENLSSFETQGPKSSKLPNTGIYVNNINMSNGDLTNNNQQTSNQSKHQMSHFLSQFKNIEEYSAFSKGNTNINISKNYQPNNLVDQRYSLSKLDKCSQSNFQTDNIRSVSPDIQQIEKLQKQNSLKFQIYSNNEKKIHQQQTRAFTNQDAFQSLNSQFQTESDEQLSKPFYQRDKNIRNSGYIGSGQFNSCFKFNAGIQNYRTNTTSSINTLTTKANDLKDSTEETKNSALNSQIYVNSSNNNAYNQKIKTSNCNQNLLTDDQETFNSSHSIKKSDRNQLMLIQKYISCANDIQNKIVKGSSQDVSPNNSDTYDSKSPKICDDMKIQQLQQIHTIQHEFNAKRLSDRMQSFMFLCKENNSKLQDIIGQEQLTTQFTNSNSKNNNQYLPISSQNLQQNQFYTLQQTNDTTKTAILNNQQSQPIQSTNLLQGVIQLTHNPLQRANSLTENHKYSLTPQNNTISMNRFSSPFNNQRLQGQLQNQKVQSQFSDFTTQLGQQISLGLQTKYQIQYQPQQQIQNNIQNQQQINNQQIVLYQQQQPQQNVYQDLNINQIQNNSNSMLNNHKFYNYTNSIPQQKINTNNLNNNINSKIGSPIGRQTNSNLDFLNSVQSHTPIILNQQQAVYCKNI